MVCTGDVVSTRRNVILNTVHGRLEALATLESAVLECKKKDVNTPEVKNALDFIRALYQAEVVDSTIPPPCFQGTNPQR